MKPDHKFVVTYISNCAKSGLFAVESAKKEIIEIDEKLKEAEMLRVKRMQLIFVLDHFGDTSYRKRKMSVINDIPSIQDENTEEIEEKITSFLMNKKPMTIREIINGVASYDQDSLVIRAVKILGDKDLILRLDDGLVQIK